MIQFLYILRSTSPPRFKIGLGWHLHKRTAQVDKTTKGQQSVLVAFAMPLGARWVETYLHRRYRRYHAPLRFGSGKSEYFRRGAWVIEAVAIAGLFCLAQWLIVWGAVGLFLFIGLKFGL